MTSWASHAGDLLRVLEPAHPPRQVLEEVWRVCASWDGVAGIWLRCHPGHVMPSGTFLVGSCPDNAVEIGDVAGVASAEIHTDGLPSVARRIQDSNVNIGVVLVPHEGAVDAATFIADALSRYCLDRRRLQLEARELEEENQLLRQERVRLTHDHGIIHVSGIVENLITAATRAAASDATVVIQGETGTGKELFANLIHQHSPRAARPIVSINAGALAPSLLESELFGHVRGAFTGAEHDHRGLFVQADKGTLFLDEIGELPLEAQTRLLRVLQERTVTPVGGSHSQPVDVRIIVATHRDLSAEVAAGRFRQDLFYRLNVVNLSLPSLRERREDIPVLVNHFLQRFNREHFKLVERIPTRVMDRLVAYAWPGNIRELENCIQKMVVLSQGHTLAEALLPPSVMGALPESSTATDEPSTATFHRSGPASIDEAIASWAEDQDDDLIGRLNRLGERTLIVWALNAERGVKLRAANRLGINRVTLDRKLVEYNIQVKRGLGVIEPTAE